MIGPKNQITGGLQDVICYNYSTNESLHFYSLPVLQVDKVNIQLF